MKLDRDGWNELCQRYLGPARDDEMTVTVRGPTTEVESHDGVVQAAIYAHRDATDVRVGDVQILVSRDRTAVIVKRGPYPIRQWDLLWEGRHHSSQDRAA